MKKSRINLLIKIEQLLFFLVIFFLPTQLGKHFWPDFSFIYSLKVDYLSPVIYFWDLLILGLLLIFFITSHFNKLAFNIILVFLLVQAFSLISSDNLGASLVRLEQLIIISGLAVYISSKKLIDIKKPLFWGLVLATAAQSLIAILQFILNSSIGFWILGEREFSISTPAIAKFNLFGAEFLRAYGTFSHPNVLAGFMVISIPLVFYFKRSLLSYFIIFLAALTILLSFSRSSMLIILVQASYILKNKLKVLLLVLFLLLPLIYIRFSSIFNFDSLSLLRREELSEIAITHFLSSPIIGVGLNNFINTTSSSSLIAGPSRFLQPVHNIFLLSLSETGLLGFIGFLIFISAPIIKFFKKKDLLGVFLFCWLAILFIGLLDHYFLTIAQGQRLFFLIWGLCMLEYSSGNNQENNHPN